MEHDTYTDSYIADILAEVKTIALVGASNKEDRPSYRVMKYMQDHGYRVVPVNPGMAGQTILGEIVHGSLDDIPDSYEMVDIFRNSEAAGAVSDEAVKAAQAKGIKVVWMQIDVRNDEAAARAEKAGIKVVMNRCPKIELARMRN